MKQAVLISLILVLSGCASFLKPIERHIEGGNTLYSSAQPNIRLQVDNNIPYLGKSSITEYKKYTNDTGGSNQTHDVYVFASKKEQFLDRSVEVQFSKISIGSHWIKGFDSDLSLKTGVQKHESGTYYTAIYKYSAGSNDLVEELLERSDIYPSPCRIYKGYMNVLKGIRTEKITIYYSERIKCRQLNQLDNEWGSLTSEGEVFINEFSKRADKAFTISINR